MNDSGTAPKKLLVVEDDPGLQAQLKWAYDDYEVLIAGDFDSAIELLRAEEPGVVTLDLGLPPDPDGTREGFRVLKAILEVKPDTKVIVVSGHGERASALAAIASGAWDFYQKPIDIEELGLIVRRAFHVHELEVENGRLAERGSGDNRVLGGMITGAPEMLKVARTIERVANLDVSVMLLGASGTGKELLARGLHEASGRRDGAFVAINCAAIPETMLEAILFGYERGAYTGAQGAHAGKFEQAHGGTLLLDEVSELPLNLQSKLLRVLQEREVERLGSSRTIALDTRVVAATNRPLRRLVEQGRFREDLYYRLSVFPLEIPPLRERPGDVLPLFAASLRRHCRGRRTVPTLTEAAEHSLRTHGWPGNVRELDNLAQRALVLLHGDVISTPHLHFEAATTAAAAAGPAAGTTSTPSMPAAERLDDALRSSETRLILDALQRGQGSRKRAAEILGISPRTLRYKLAQLRAAGVQTVGA